MLLLLFLVTRWMLTDGYILPVFIFISSRLHTSAARCYHLSACISRLQPSDVVLCTSATAEVSSSLYHMRCHYICWPLCTYPVVRDSTGNIPRRCATYECNGWVRDSTETPHSDFVSLSASLADLLLRSTKYLVDSHVLIWVPSEALGSLDSIGYWISDVR
jgi:hypothetical protein